MPEQFTDREIRRTNRNLLLTSGIITLLVLGLFLVGWRYFLNFFAGPAEVSPAALAAISDPGAVTRYFVRVAAEREVPTGMQEITITRSKYTHTERSRRVSAEYKALLVGDRLLIAKTPKDAKGPSYDGALSPMPRELATKLGLSKSKLMLPYMLDAGGFRGPGYWGLGIGGLVLAFSVAGLVRALRRRGERTAHPMFARLAKFGDAAALAARIDDEADKRDITPSFGPVLLSPSFLLHPQFFDVGVVPLADLIWAHGKVTKHSTNGIPTGKTFAVTVYDRLGTSIELQCKEDVMNRLLGELSRRAPWALYGHSPELLVRWTKSRAELIAAVDARRQGARAPQAAGPQAGTPPPAGG